MSPLEVGFIQHPLLSTLCSQGSRGTSRQEVLRILQVQTNSDIGLAGVGFGCDPLCLILPDYGLQDQLDSGVLNT